MTIRSLRPRITVWLGQSHCCKDKVKGQSGPRGWEALVVWQWGGGGTGWVLFCLCLRFPDIVQ
jgi:hypothetical protein